MIIPQPKENTGTSQSAQKGKCQAGGEKQLYFAIRVFSKQDFVWEHVFCEYLGPNERKTVAAFFMAMGLMSIFL